MRRIAILVLSTSLAACTVIKVENGTVHRIAGFVEVRPVDDQPIVTTTQSYGLRLANRALTVGYSEEKSVTLADQSKCQMLVMFENESASEIEDWKEFFTNNPKICVDGG